MEKKYYNKNDIQVLFTSLVNKYLNNGYSFNLAESARGHQGEELKTDLTNDNGKTVIRILVIHCSDVVEVQVRKYSDSKNKTTLWNNEGEMLEEHSFFCVNWYYDENATFVMDKDFFEEIKELKRERAIRNYGKAEFISENAFKPALKIIQRKKGYKSVSLKEISSIEHKGCEYIVRFNSNRNNLTLEA